MVYKIIDVIERDDYFSLAEEIRCRVAYHLRDTVEICRNQFNPKTLASIIALKFGNNIFEFAATPYEPIDIENIVKKLKGE